MSLAGAVLNSASALARKVRSLDRIIERSSMESPVPEKQKPSHRLGSLNSGARTRTTGAGAALNSALALARRVRPLAE
ncbi:hypothetical protein C0558_08565 [Serratia marcescens]|nr:hypothetical protein C0558_08565 [Serratia marcescens]